MILEEIWKESSLPYVMVSNFGNFYRKEMPVYKVTKTGVKYETLLPPRVLVPSNNGLGYLQVKVQCAGIRFRKYAHVLVWEAFNGSLQKGYEIDHIDCTKSNNKLSNLQLVTRKENMVKCHKDNPHIIYNLIQYTKF